MTTGSVLHINEVYDETESYADPDQPKAKHIDFIGQPVKDFKELENTLKAVDEEGYVKKKIIEEGGGLPLHDGNTVSIAFSGYWENENEAFDARSLHKPLVCMKSIEKCLIMIIRYIFMYVIMSFPGGRFKGKWFITRATNSCKIYVSWRSICIPPDPPCYVWRNGHSSKN